MTTALPLSGGANSLQILRQPLEQILVPYVNYLTSAIDIAAGLIIGVSAVLHLPHFLEYYENLQRNKLLTKKQLDFA